MFKLGGKIHFHYVSRLRICQLCTVLTGARCGGVDRASSSDAWGPEFEPGHPISKYTTSIPETKWLFGTRGSLSCNGGDTGSRPKKSAYRCNYWESENDCFRNGNNLYKLKKHSILDHLAISGLQIISAGSRLWSKFEHRLKVYFAWWDQT